MFAAMVFAGGLLVASDFAGAQEEAFQVSGRVTNSFCDYGIEGVEVEIATYVEKSIAVTTTNENGEFIFEGLPHDGPYEVGFMARSYRTQELFDVMAGDVLEVALVPRGVTTPGKPNAISSPKSVYIDWPANPEFNLKGYNVYRTLVTENGEPLGEPEKLNGAPVLECDDELVEGVEYIDSTVQKGSYYIYQIQAISGADRPSELSEASDPPVKGQWLTIFFPDVYKQEDGLYLWEREDDGLPMVRIPVASRCAYDVDATGMMIVGEVTADLLNAEPFEVSLTGITAGMAYSANVIYGAAEQNIGDHQVRIASADSEERPLYGSGELFNIYLNPKVVLEEECGPLHLVDNDITGDGVTVYNDPWEGEIEIELEDGVYCTAGGCLHGDVNVDGRIDVNDAQYIVDFKAKQEWAPINECYMEAWDINLDGRITPQDATLILRFVEGLPINPPTGVKSADLALVSFAAAAAAAEKADTQPTVWAEKPVVAIGDTKDVTVYITGAAPLAGFTLTAAYAADEVEFVAVALGSAIPVDAVFSHSYEISGEQDEYGSLVVVVSDSNATMAKSDAELVTLSFKRNAGAAAVVPVLLTSFDMNDSYGHAPRQTDPMAPVIKDTAPPPGEGEEEGEDEGEVEGEGEGEDEEGEGEGENGDDSDDDDGDDDDGDDDDGDDDDSGDEEETKKRRVLFCGSTDTSGGFGGDLILLGLLLSAFATAPYLRKRQN